MKGLSRLPDMRMELQHVLLYLALLKVGRIAGGLTLGNRLTNLSSLSAKWFLLALKSSSLHKATWANSSRQTVSQSVFRCTFTVYDFTLLFKDIILCTQSQPILHLKRLALLYYCYTVNLGTYGWQDDENDPSLLSFLHQCLCIFKYMWCSCQ